MPLKLIKPRKGKSQNWTIRGSYLGFRINQSTGVGDKETAKAALAALIHDIEYGKFDRNGPTFAHAALAYMEAGGERTYMKRLLEHFGDTPISHIDQSAIDRAATALYPEGTGATRNRSVYTPVCAVLRRAGIRLDLRRPEDAGGRRTTSWLWPEQAGALIGEATKLNKEFGILCLVLLYTGMRLGEALGLTWQNMRLDDGYAYLPDTKNSDPRAVFLPPVAVDAIRGLPPRRRRNSNRARVFRYHKSGRLYLLLCSAAAKAGVDLPERSAFHIFRHTWGSWMMRYGGLNTKQLVGTGAWKDQKSAARYAHTVASEDASRAANLPVVYGVKMVENALSQIENIDKTDS